MSGQRLYVDQALRDQRDGFGVRLVVAELEADVDLSERRVHERDRLEGLSDTDDEHRTTESRCLYTHNSVSMLSSGFPNDTISFSLNSHRWHCGCCSPRQCTPTPTQPPAPRPS